MHMHLSINEMILLFMKARESSDREKSETESQLYLVE